MAYPNAIVGWNYPPGVYVHPTPLYETLAYTLVFAFLWSIRKRPHPDGTLFWWYLVLASSARFFIEFVRINPRIVAGLSEAQLISIALVAIGSWKLLTSGAVPLRSALARLRAVETMKRWGLPFGFLLVALAGAFYYQQQQAAGRAGFPAPDFALQGPQRPHLSPGRPARQDRVPQPLGDLVPAVPHGDALHGTACTAGCKARTSSCWRSARTKTAARRCGRSSIRWG